MVFWQQPLGDADMYEPGKCNDMPALDTSSSRFIVHYIEVVLYRAPLEV